MPIRVAFLTFYFEAWEALAQIWQDMVEDERFEPVVITVPRKLTGDTQYTDESKVHEYFEAAGIPHLRFDYEDSLEGLRRLRDELKPDYVFLNYPWQRNYQPGYRVEKLSQFTKVCYVPYYSLPLVNEPGTIGVAPHLYRQRSHQLASLVFTQDQNVLDAYATTQRGNGYVHLTGSPKIDSLMTEAKEGHGAWPIHRPGDHSRHFRLVWAPHHSYGENWLNFGLFQHMYLQMLEFAKTHPDVDIVMRPHPFLFGTLVDRNVVSAAQLEDWLTEWLDLPNTVIHTAGGYASMFKACDLMLTDGISFIGEFPLVTGKPAVFLENRGHWSFSPLGEIAAAANLRLESFGQFDALFDEIRTTGMPDRSEEIAALRKAAAPYPGQASARIVDIVAQDYLAGTPLVDAHKITEVAWENEPGKEPLVD